MPNNYHEIIEELFSFERAEIKPGLERINVLLKILGNPEYSFKSIHIAGTNGKGTICNLLASILQECGMKIGLFTSPHILRFNERIKVNGTEISDEDIVKINSFLINDAKNIGATFFEISTAIAFEHFKRSEVDVAIIETGMGGNFDSTNVLTPILSIITQIDLDHQEYLGNSLEEIAKEKAGIIKPNVPVIICDNHAELKKVFIDKAREMRSPIIYVEDNFQISNFIIDEKLNMTCDISDGINLYKSVFLPVAGTHQTQNLKAIIAAYNYLKFHYPLNEEVLYSGLRNVKKNTGFNSRIDLISNSPIIIVDVAHNPAGIGKLVECIDLSPLSKHKFNIYFAAMKDKDIKSMLAILLPITNVLNIIQLDNKRAAQSSEIEKIAIELGFSSIKLWDNPKESFNDINKDSIICGSFYTIEAFYNTQK